MSVLLLLLPARSVSRAIAAAELLPKGAIGGCLRLYGVRPGFDACSAVCPDPAPTAQDGDLTEEGRRMIDAVEPRHVGARVDAM